MAPLKIDAPVLVAFGAAILGYRVVLTLRFGLKARDIAVLSSEKIIQNINFVAVGAGLVNLYDFDRAQTLLREKGEGYVGMLLIALGTLFTLWALMLPRNEAHLPAVVVAFFAGIALALMLTKGGFYFWRHVGEPRLFDCAWLEWLEIQVLDPLDQLTTPDKNLVVIALASPHPDLENFLQRTFGDGPLTSEKAKATERWIADRAVKWDRYLRLSAPWRVWRSQRMSARR